MAIYQTISNNSGQWIRDMYDDTTEMKKLKNMMISNSGEPEPKPEPKTNPVLLLLEDL